ncbi:haloacid dehalogenase-like hydrolase [Corynebacterium capitovis DSM 44611]|nr:HAD hydrolase family protein [Corynebacterium capitovis]WKD56947.1 haloacid dehalogenase-like hydrolase [Corynebacterium capitovis DSM 44611]
MRGSRLAFDYNVLSNGGSGTSSSGELLFAHLLDATVLDHAITEFSDRAGVAVFGTTIGDIDGVFANNTGALSEFTAHFTPMTREDIPRHDFAVVPLWVPGDPTLRDEVAAWAVELDGVSVARNQDYIDIMAPGRSKGAGISELLDVLQLPRESIKLYTFGDSWNDLSMHRIADVSHSFAHSPAEVRADTDHVISSVEDALSAYL